MPFILEDKTFETQIRDIAIKVSKILGVKFASIDIIELTNEAVETAKEYGAIIITQGEN